MVVLCIRPRRFDPNGVAASDADTGGGDAVVVGLDDELGDRQANTGATAKILIAAIDRYELTATNNQP